MSLKNDKLSLTQTKFRSFKIPHTLNTGKIKIRRPKKTSNINNIINLNFKNLDKIKAN